MSVQQLGPTYDTVYTVDQSYRSQCKLALILIISLASWVVGDGGRNLLLNIVLVNIQQHEMFYIYIMYDSLLEMKKTEKTNGQKENLYVKKNEQNIECCWFK